MEQQENEKLINDQVQNPLQQGLRRRIVSPNKEEEFPDFREGRKPSPAPSSTDNTKPVDIMTIFLARGSEDGVMGSNVMIQVNPCLTENNGPWTKEFVDYLTKEIGGFVTKSLNEYEIQCSRFYELKKKEMLDKTGAGTAPAPPG